MINKKLIFILAFFLVLNSVYSTGGTVYNNTQGIDWNYEHWQTEMGHLTFIVPGNLISQGGSFVSGVAEYPVQAGYARLFLFPTNTEDYVFRKAPTDLSVGGIGGPNNFNFPKYALTELNSLLCEVTNINPIDSSVLEIQSNLKPLQAGGQDMINYELVIPHLLEKYYYMKAYVYAQVVDVTTGAPVAGYEKITPQSTHGIYPLNVDPSLIDPEIHGSSVPYVLLKPDAVEVDFGDSISNIRNEFRELCDGGQDMYCGDFKIVYHAVPIDMKCDFFEQNLLSINDVSPSTIEGQVFSVNLRDKYARPLVFNNNSIGGGTQTYKINLIDPSYLLQCRVNNDPISMETPNSFILNNIEPGKNYNIECRGLDDNWYVGSFVSDQRPDNIAIDTDSDSIPDKYDRCIYEDGPQILSGCSELFEVTCTDIRDFTVGVSDLNTETKSAGMTYNSYTNEFYCSSEFESNSFKVMGSETRITDESRNIDMLVNTQTINDAYITVVRNFSCNLFSNQDDPECLGLLPPASPITKPLKVENARYVCVNNNMGLREVVGFCDVRYFGPTLGSPEFEEMKIDYSSKIIKANDTNQFRFQYNYGIDQIDFVGPTFQTITLDTDKDWSQMGRTHTYRDNQLIRTEAPDIIKIALFSHKIKDFRDVNEAVEFVNNSVNLMKTMNITKNLTSVGTRTEVRIKVESVPSTRNLTVYQIIPKTFALTSNQINFINDGGGQRFIVDNDPIIGWYFNESTGSEEIIYEIPTGGEGGIIIITQEPVIFNGGDLIINYRQGGCALGEAHLFDLDIIEDSVIRTKGTSTYQVCVDHLTEDLTDSNANNFLHVLNYTLNGNVSINNLSGFNFGAYLSTTNTSLFWDISIQETNPGGYSCLGSVTDLDSSTFGDCEFVPENRIWLRLGEDSTPPTARLDSYIPSNTAFLRVIMEEEPSGSGLNSYTYCVSDSDNTCTDWTSIESISGISFTTGNIRVSCPNNWGCIKYIHVNVSDNAGNMGNHILYANLLDKGSACQPDCSAKPSPNRYIKECRNLNGCTYFTAPWETTEEERGLAAAEACHMATLNSWVSFNATHEILCPLGPLRENRFTSEPVTLEMPNCKHVQKTPHVAYLDGQQITLSIIVCKK